MTKTLDEREQARVEQIMKDDPNAIFVFGSNQAGRHGAGAARVAFDRYGANYGTGVGLRGRSYAIPTKDLQIETLPLDVIEFYVKEFLHVARTLATTTFAVTRIGCGLAGYGDSDIAPMFRDAPENCKLPEGWRTPTNEFLHTPGMHCDYCGCRVTDTAVRLLGGETYCDYRCHIADHVTSAKE
jgi:hypothetical protein